MQNELIKKIADKKALIGIFGLGYVGLPLALRFAAEGYNVLGFDIDETKVRKLEKGQSYIQHIPTEHVQKPVQAGLLKATSDFAKTKDVDAIIICVPTPLNKYREPDISYIVKTIEACLPHLRKGQIISLESTTYPGTTDEEIVTRLEKNGFKPGEDVFVVFSPEREDPGRMDFNTKTIPKVCGGYTKRCLEAGVALYSAVIDKVVPVSSTRTAEMTKLLENIHRSVNIGLVNEIKIVADKMGIDIHEVVRAAATKPFGFVPYYPGPGLGGHCIPIDPFYLTWKAREYGVHTKFIELAGEINSQMPHYVVSKIIQGLNESGKAVKGSRVLMLGIAYKKNVDDMRESPCIPIMAALMVRGATVDYADPHVPVFPKEFLHDSHGVIAEVPTSAWDMKSVVLDAKTIAQYDACIIGTDHDAFDYQLLQKNAELIVDTRGRYLEPMKNVVKA